MPLYIGAGFDNCFLTPQLAERTRLKLDLNLARLPAEATVLLVLGEPDVRFHIEDRFGTAVLGEDQAIAAAVARYAATVASLRKSAPQHTFAVLSCIPSTRAEYCRLSAVYDRQLEAAMRAEGIAYADIRPRLIDPATQLLRSEFDADGIHLSTVALPQVIGAMKDSRLLDIGTHVESDFRWSFNYRIPLDHGLETRLWGDKPRSAIADAVVRQLAHRHATDKDRRWAVPDCAEGYLAFGLAAAGFSRVSGVEPEPTKLLMAQRAARLFRGPEAAVTFGAPDPAGTSAEFAVLYPWAAGDPDTMAARLDRAAQAGTVCYAPLVPGDAARIVQQAGQRRAEVETIGLDGTEAVLLKYFKSGA